MALGPYPAENPEPRPDPIVVALIGNGLTHDTSPVARKVSIYVHAPIEGAERARPTVNGAAIRGANSGTPYVFEAPAGFTVPVLVIATRAGSNDIVIVEEF
jgi:hypothetical protein